MKDDSELDELLRQRFESLKTEDVRRAPAFGAVLERARVSVDALGPHAVVVGRASAPRRWRRPPRRFMMWAGPVLIAAGFGAIWFLPQRAADREFDRVVEEWSRTAQVTLHSPTDGLLTLPGSEFLGGMPPVGRGPATAGRRGRS